MTASENEATIHALATAERELSIGTDLAHTRVMRLLREGFMDPNRAIQGLERSIGRHGVEGTIRILQTDGIARWNLFGLTRDNVLSLRRGPAREALAALPEAIRERSQLALKLSDVRTNRIERMQQLSRGRAPASDEDDARSRKGQQRARGRKT